MTRMNKPPLIGSGYKYCFACQQPKPLADFYRAKGKPGGYTSQCKLCARESAAKVRQRKAIVEAAYKRLRDRESPRMIDLVGLDLTLQGIAA